MDNATMKKLLTLAFKCSPGDLSVLEAALKRRGDHQLLTGPDSANFHFWSACTAEGLMERLPDHIMDTGNSEMRAPAFAITPDGWDDMADLQDIIQRNYDPRSYHMSKIYNELCWPFIENFYTAVEEGGGRDEDIETLAGMLLTRLITRRYKKPEYDDKIMLIGARARQMLKTYDR